MVTKNGKFKCDGQQSPLTLTRWT